MVEILNRNRKLVAVLENAHNVCRETPLNSLATATFELPYNDPKLKECRMRNCVRITRGGEKPMLYRILKRTKVHKSTGMVTFTCEHVSASLIDNNIDGYVQIGNIGTYTRDVIEYVLSRQKVQNWVLGRCDFARQFEYGFDNETLYACLKSIAEPITDKYKWDFDTSEYPWTINLVKIDENAEPLSYFRYGKNIQGITVTEDSTNMATRIKCLGWGEGVNQLDISSVNNGSLWLIDEEAEAEYGGSIEYIWVDRRFTHPETLMARGQVILDNLKTPRREYTLDVVNLYPITDNLLDEPRAGDVTRCIDSELGEDIKTIITNVSERDIFGAYEVTINIANTPEDVPGTIAEQADRLRNEQLYSQGAKSIYVMNFADNADQTHPAEIDLFIPADVVNINYVNMMIRFSAFRAYSLTAASGGSTVQATTTQPAQTSSAGGATVQATTNQPATTSSSGGGTYGSTQYDGGATSYTTSGASSKGTTDLSYYLSRTGVVTDYTSLTYTSGNSQSHRHQGSDIVALVDEAMRNHDHGIAHTHSISISFAAHAHQFSVSAHTHETQSHGHNVTIPSHTHETPSHGHTVTIPSHTHSAVYGIYEGSRASTATITIDGRSVSIPIGQDFDITTLLSVDGGGKIKRGATQQIRITPNTLTRISATATVGLFTGSHAGQAA